MRLEVLVENSEPEIYPLNKSEVVIGSGDVCDIVLIAEGISRKHLKIFIEGDDYFVADQGSTNGTFINEERLIPGRRVEFTSFFPVRLASSVLISLLSDEDSSDYNLKEFASKLSKLEDTPTQSRESEDSTRVVRLSDFNKPRTQELIQKRAKTIQEKRRTRPAVAAKPAKKQDSMLKWYLLAALILGGSVYYQVELKESVDSTQTTVEPNPSQDLIEQKTAQGPVIDPNKIVESELVTKTDIDKLLSFIKCTEPAEVSFCNAIPELRTDAYYGAYQRENTMFLFVDQKPWIEKAVGLLPSGTVDPSMVFKGRELAPQERIELDNTLKAGKQLALYDEIVKLGFLEFFRERVLTMPPEVVSNFNLYLVFVETNADNKFVSKILTLNPLGASKLSQRYNSRLRQSIKTYGYRAGIDMEIFFNYY